jgi:hypothetical protein
MFGTVLVATTGIVLPVLIAVWFTPRAAGPLEAAIPQMWRGRLLLRQGRRFCALLGAVVFKGHLPDNFVASASARLG